MTELAGRAARAVRSAYGRHPDGVAFAPGRVNLIGEHIDYHGGPVLPAALERGIAVAFAARDDAIVRAVSVPEDGSGSAHPEVVFHAGPNMRPDRAGGWGNYLRAAALAALEEGARPGADLVVTSDLPEASGLSSSSALVVATGLALLEGAGRGRELSGTRRRHLAVRFAEAERFTGTRGGGMDQAASLGGRPGHALRITFDPLAWTPVPLPAEVAFVVAHSGVRAEKSGAAQAAYNRIRAGAEEPEIAAHIREEKARVEAFVAAVDPPDLQRLGELVDASHASLRDRLGVSHPTLELLVDAARSAGATGARLTGAGFGGSIVAVCPRAGAGDVVRALREVQRGLPGDPAPAFVARAGAGARVIRGVEGLP